MLRQANRKNIFTPENNINENIWFSVDFNDVQEATGKKFNKFIVYLEDKNIITPKPKKLQLTCQTITLNML